MTEKYALQFVTRHRIRVTHQQSRGYRVRLIAAKLGGLEGVLIRKKKELRFAIWIDLIQRSIRIDVDSRCAEPGNHSDSPARARGPAV